MPILALIFLVLTLTGCGETKPLNVKKVTYACYVGDPRGIYLKVISDDLTVKRYEIHPDTPHNPNVLEGELPPEDRYTMEEDVISKESWDEFVKLLSEKKFMDLPEEIDLDGVYDGVSRYIKVETDEGSYTVGGYCAGEGKSRAHKRFSDILEGMGNLK